MTEIPEDIIEKARSVVIDIMGYPPPSTAVNKIADAILAERERCAEIAEQYANTYCARISDSLAAAIREVE